jgi:hypothetical protein
MNGHDALFGCLGSPERRYVVRELDEGGTTSLKEVAAEIADDDRRESSRVELELHHRHLPKLDEEGVLNYDPEIGTVAPTDRTDVASDLARSVATDGSTDESDAAATASPSERVDPTVRE